MRFESFTCLANDWPLIGCRLPSRSIRLTAFSPFRSRFADLPQLPLDAEPATPVATDVLGPAACALAGVQRFWLAGGIVASAF
jgi:hypothetical protein